MKETPLTATHIELGARMMPFAGYNMPVSYSGINEEHINVRENVGLFDVSHMGQFFLKGEKSLDLIQLISSNDASGLVIGQAQYTCMPNKEGGIVDDFLVYKLSEDEYMLVVNASNIEKDFNWISEANTFGVSIEDRSDDMALLALQGPKAIEVLKKISNSDISSIEYYHFTSGEVAGISNVIISATGYTGSGGFELYLDNKDAVTVWNKLLEAGKEENILPVGLGARDTLRLEMGFCLYGNDIDDKTSPIEAGLGWITKTKKETEFHSKEIFVNQRKEGIKKKLVAFKVDDRRVPRHGYEIVDKDENVIGTVTSGTLSPSLQIPIGLGYVKKENAKIGSEIGIKLRNKVLSATIIKLPFYKKEEK
ncbi:MAG: glycine cleavage system aminomethyltransferase GcvT [Bacteroidia bacterium]|nr:glycine cleavage system aminomethyltransferase GcvT [Bacteroidia bacterium]